MSNDETTTATSSPITKWDDRARTLLEWNGRRMTGYEPIESHTPSHEMRRPGLIRRVADRLHSRARGRKLRNWHATTPGASCPAGKREATPS